MVTSEELKRLYLDFFKQKGHSVIANASLIPENDPSVLFTTAGMHPLVPFLMGQKHPHGKRLVNFQKCIRTGDIDEVGDSCHHSFFEMLGNWSLGDYFKQESISWSFEFLTDKKWLGIDSKKISVTVFAGDSDAPRDEESARIWKSVGIPDSRIFYLPKDGNWWENAGGGPCGPDTEIFYDTQKEPCGKDCKPGCHCGKYVEIWNNVFMQYNKTKDGKYEILKQKNVDTGMGVERTTAVLQGKTNDYDTEIFLPIMQRIKDIAKIPGVLPHDQERSVRIIADHLRAATFVLAEGVVPKNVEHGYILRRLIRRAIRHAKLIGIEKSFLAEIASLIISMNKEGYPYLESKRDFIIDELGKEEEKFTNTLSKGLRKFKAIANEKGKISGEDAFLLFQSFGFPIEMTEELGSEQNITVDAKGFKMEFEKHQETSRTGSEKKFKGGLGDSSEQTTKLHTATHILNEALRIVLKSKNIFQKGSNITPERLRFDFSFDRKLSDVELKEVEKLVNEQIGKGLVVKREEMSVEEAKKKGAQAVFESKYGEKVSVYSIGDFSVEICGGPHVGNTKELGNFKIIKEEGVAAGVRRIKACLE
jgi:alanyl-tRNA synthetase